MIGGCEVCDRWNVPISHVTTGFGVDVFVCYMCRGETDSDPYCELELVTEMTNLASLPNPFMPAPQIKTELPVNVLKPAKPSRKPRK